MVRGMTADLRFHFALPPHLRDRAQSGILAEQLVRHARWFDAFAVQRLQRVGINPAVHLDSLRDFVRPHFERVLNTYSEGNYDAYMLFVRTRQITEYLQQFAQEEMNQGKPDRG